MNYCQAIESRIVTLLFEHYIKIVFHIIDFTMYLYNIERFSSVRAIFNDVQVTNSTFAIIQSYLNPRVSIFE